MKIAYLCNFDTNGYAGKNRATRQKLKALNNQIDDLVIVSANFKKLKFLELFCLELKAIYFILTNKPDVFISRGFVGFFVQKIAKYKKIITVREVHADIISEISQTNKFWIVKKLLIPLALYAQEADRQTDIRIFNHPDLLHWYKSKIKENNCDFFVYNGFDYGSKSNLFKIEARKKYNLSDGIKYLIFTGSASYWHGVDYLVELQKEINKLNENIQIVCGGGKVSEKYDPDRVLINISPLDDKGCADLLQAGDACILPVRQSRVSPGSPLKLYDYILHEKFVITQENINGYSDEVDKYGYGMLVDFNKPYNSALKIIEKLKIFNDDAIKLNIEQFSWNNRMEDWLEGIKISKNSFL
jgi:hypothetical protein